MDSNCTDTGSDWDLLGDGRIQNTVSLADALLGLVKATAESTESLQGYLDLLTARTKGDTGIKLKTGWSKASLSILRMSGYDSPFAMPQWSCQPSVQRLGDAALCLSMTYSGRVWSLGDLHESEKVCRRAILDRKVDHPQANGWTDLPKIIVDAKLVRGPNGFWELEESDQSFVVRRAA